MRVEEVDLSSIDMAALDAFPDRVFCQRRHWLEFLTRITGGRPVIGELTDGRECVGYISGLVFRRLGVPIFGSPFVGWTTPYIGFNLRPGIPRREALRAVESFVFRELGCAYLEICDRYVTAEDLAGLGFEVVPFDTYVSDLRRGEDELFKSMKSMTRRCIRKAQKSGIIIEEAEPDGFISEYYSHLKEVFARQGLAPTYDEMRLKALVDCVFDSGDLLLLRARAPDGASIATAVYCGFGGGSYFWGNGSLQKYQILRPNQALHWYALCYWKRRGAKHHDWGGGGTYKQAYGPSPMRVWRLRKARHRILTWGRNLAQASYYGYRAWTAGRYMVVHGAGLRGTPGVGDGT